MSRVTYENVPATAAQEQLRTTHGVRVVSQAEEGESVTALPGGVYGFTYSPGTTAAPLFAVRRYRSRQIESATEDVTFQLQPDPEPGQDVLAAIPYSRIRRHKQVSAPNQHGFTATVMPVVPA
jgi:hypothetical protein